MILTALTHAGRLGRLPNRVRGLHAARTRNHIGPAGVAARPPVDPTQVVLMVDFVSRKGRTWWAVGLGDTLADALVFAGDSCPTDTTWRPVRWNDLYGD